METLCHKDKLKWIKIKLGYAGLFVVEIVGRSGGLAFFWKTNYRVNLLKFGRNFIDLVVENTVGGKWGLTGFYGFPESNRQRES